MEDQQAMVKDERREMMAEEVAMEDMKERLGVGDKAGRTAARPARKAD